MANVPDPTAAAWRRPTLTIDLDAAAANWRALAALAPAAEAAAVVKADGYGCGAAPVARALAAAGCRVFFTATYDEATAVEAALPPGDGAVYVFAGYSPETPAPARLRPVLNTEAACAAWAEAGGGRPVALHVDTGLSRLGLAPQALEAACAAGLTRRLNVALLLSHLACADAPDHPLNAAQQRRFAAAAAWLRAEGAAFKASLAATGGALLGPDHHFDLIRPGIGLYGGLPFAGARPVATLTAPIAQLRPVAAGETAGYGATWTAERPTLLATLALGYADGLPRSLSNRGAAFWRGRRAPIRGRVSMDSIIVDLGPEALNPGAQPDLGAPVEILGPSQSIDALAADAGTIGYEVLTRLGNRFEKRYIGTSA